MSIAEIIQRAIRLDGVEWLGPVAEEAERLIRDLLADELLQKAVEMHPPQTQYQEGIVDGMSRAAAHVRGR